METELANSCASKAVCLFYSCENEWCGKKMNLTNFLILWGRFWCVKMDYVPVRYGVAPIPPPAMPPPPDPAAAAGGAGGSEEEGEEEEEEEQEQEDEEGEEEEVKETDPVLETEDGCLPT